ncbi:ankyrin repeat domain-containing protein [Pseudomethylobacillus aquaticus]|uniref:Ankyrin repeat domain-containing protein n=1 Tax=Pseudomethylobacillus aquaticus TaxID=2676064 RepID=A0A3N0V6X6_9PROT|nr:ankyrin repeat domain-containing protein [Pseudomethylobacillus aquaticus]ROH88445.1 ankyrin repeat domain-containing protein [Pseudomethylobacillus aquaticus]
MNMLKAGLAVLALVFSMSSFALTDEEQIEFTTAVTGGNIKMVKKYLDSGKIAVNDKFFAWTPVLSAASKNQTAMVKYLAEHGADINYRHPVNYMTSLAHATFNANNELVEYLLQKGADPQIKMRGDLSILRMARDLGNTSTAELLTKYGAKDDGCQETKCF